MDLATYWKELSKNDEFLKESFEEYIDLSAGETVVPPFFFHCFRPTGEGLEIYFDKHPYGKEIFTRLKKIFDVTATNPPNTAYFVVENAKVLTEAQIITLAKSYIQSMRDILQCMNDKSVLSTEEITINIIKGCSPRCDNHYHITNDNNNTHHAIYEIKGEYFNNFKTNNEFIILHDCDCIYYMACDYDLVYYVLWPLFAEQSTIHNPYDAGFKLWQYDLEAVFMDNKTLNIYIKSYRNTTTK